MMFSQLGVTFSKFPRYNSTWEIGDNDDVLLNYLNNADGNDSLKSTVKVELADIKEQFLEQWNVFCFG